MIIKTRGIIFRTVKYSETSIIADIYTEAKGLRAYIVSGVRTQKAKVSAGLIQVMSLVEIVAYEKEGQSLHRIKEIKAAHVYSSLPFEVLKSSVGIFMAEVARRTIRESEENQELFAFLFDIFQELDATKANFANFHLAFLLELSAHLGFKPDEETYTEGAVFDLREGIFSTNTIGHAHFINENLSKILKNLLQTGWHRSHEVKITREERRQLLTDLLNFYRLHLDNFPEINSLKILQEIF